MTTAKDNYVLDLENNRRGYALNRMFGSFRHAENRDEFAADEAAYCDHYGLTSEQKKVVLQRDWIGMLDLGASIFYSFKLATMDRKSMQYLGGVFTGMTAEQFAEALQAGGRKFG
ncbi:protocatechuate 4,5-dioxygenase alpha chain [Kibdelosporangium banguiense]|uniref:Protocatechuate 4,5-dioxygenase alpha chain n=1 Tax=Kibdelosporangium banguiense TaxID=1365924 RepID=A0ABS4TRD3_9PSEU|nr:protocatechuate 3,4-dioxygenase [Kibdelosporangium banguiense]MBP2326961.1 protocatechuate 4,5-dioxygenase alpha chain [Kibdelosporangium banguiense]